MKHDLMKHDLGSHGACKTMQVDFVLKYASLTNRLQFRSLWSLACIVYRFSGDLCQRMTPFSMKVRI